MKEDNSLGNSDAVLPSPSRFLTQTIPSAQIDLLMMIKSVVETIMDKETVT